MIFPSFVSTFLLRFAKNYLQQADILYKHSTIHYCVFGKGSKIMFCFHGYSKDGFIFYILEQLLGKDYTLICIDLPFHGQTIWNDGLTFTAQDLVNIITLIKPLSYQSISLLGYSMGGRVALQLIEVIPDKIERVVLIAPDGLHKNSWYHFTTQTMIGNRLFNYIVNNPVWLFNTINLAGKFKILDANVLSIAHYYLGDKSQRLLFYNRWITMRKFKPNLLRIKSIIHKNKIPVRFLFGKYDEIILSERSEIFKKDKENIQIHIIEGNHRLMQEKYADLIAKLFYQ